MEARPTVITILAAALLIAVLALGGMAGLLLARPAQAQSGGVTGMRQVTVIGTGEHRVAPDMATVQIGVETNAATTQEALAQNNTQAAAIIDQIKALGIEERDIQTSGFNIYPTYSDDGRQVTGYTVSNTVSVTIRNLAVAGGLLDSVVQAGANRVYGVNFGLSDPEAARGEARTAAMANARARAEQLAQAGGVAIGQVLVISENIGSTPIVPLPAMMSDRIEGAGGAVPVQAGEKVITATVQVTYDLR
jgi:uncharacterized protein YggE